MQMQKSAIALLLLAALAYGPAAVAGADQPNPLSKVIELLEGLEAKVVKDGEAEVKAFKEYVEWCDDGAKGLHFEIRSAGEKKERLEAGIAKAVSCISSSSISVEELAATVASEQQELKNATLIREKEGSDFVAAELQLVDAVETLGRAVGVLQREMAKNPALLQAQVDTTSLQRLVQTMGAVVDAAGIPGSDGRKLLALVQSQSGQASADASADADALDADEAALGAPAAATYATHSTSILEVLEDMKEKAEAELADLRQAETKDQHNYDMLKQSLQDSVSANGKDMDVQKANKAGCEEDKAADEGELATTVKDLANAEAALALAQQTCMQAAADHEASVKGRDAELKAVAEATKILAATSSGAVSQAYSLLQTSSSSQMRMRMRPDLARAEIVNIIRHLAKQHHSAALAQLASKINAAMNLYGAAGGRGVFDKVKGLIVQMLDKLMAEASTEAVEKAYCDEEMAKTEEKKGDLELDAAKLTSKIDKAASASVTLEAEMKELQEEIATLLEQQAEMDKLREEEAADFAMAKADLELGIQGVQKALGILRDYYGGSAALLQDDAKFGAFLQQPAVPKYHSKASGAGDGIISILETCEADFSKDLAERTTAEEDAQTAYDKMSQENTVTKTMKDQDVKYKKKEYLALQKSIASWSMDLGTVRTELTAVLDYYKGLKARCIAKPEKYEARKKRRDAEIAGLKQALQILETETAFLQQGGQGALRR